MIEVGEYCRSKNGYISKIIEIDNYIWFDSKINKESGMAVYELSQVEFKNLIVKHSKNIIDLIEEGDYVNGDKISNVDKINNTIYLEWENRNMYSTDIINDKFIWSIVTKEQFKSVEYRIEEE